MTEIVAKEDISSLYRIVDEANRNYLRESKRTERPAFNILRILSSYRLLYPQSHALYNAIIYIAKNYDPQTINQWNKAIDDISKKKNNLPNKNNYCIPQVSMHTKTYQNSFNRSRLNESSQHFQSKSYAQIKIPQQKRLGMRQNMSDSDEKQISQTNADTGNRFLHTKADSMMNISKNHYISFEPYHQLNSDYDKENINFTNIVDSRRHSAYQYVDAIHRDIHRTSNQSRCKTPIDQSFIKNINTSESPYIFSKGHQEVDPYEEQMNIRAKTFYHFNLHFKGFSLLQANLFVSLKMKQYETKAKMKHRSTLLLKSFDALRQNINLQKTIRMKQSTASKFYCISTQRKTFNLIKLIYELRQKKHSKFVVDKLNKLNYQFIFSLLLSIKIKNDGQQSNYIDLNNKINELICKQETEKICLVVKYFGTHSWIKEDSIHQMINKYRLTLCRQMFNILQRQKDQNTKWFQIRQKNLARQSFYALKIRWNRIKCYKKMVNVAQAKRNKLLIEKAMKALIEAIYSTKLYSKRCEYINRKYLHNLKSRVYSRWIDGARQQMMKTKQMNLKAAKSLTILELFLKKYSFRMIKQKLEEISNKYNIAVQYLKSNKKLIVIQSLKQLVAKRSEQNQMTVILRRLSTKFAFFRWVKQSKISQSISKMENTIKRYLFRVLVLPHFAESLQIVKEIKDNQLGLLRKAMMGMKVWLKDEQLKVNSLNDKLMNKLVFLYKINLVRALSLNYKKQQLRKFQQELSRKSSAIKKNHREMLIMTFLKQLKQENTRQKQISQKKEITSKFLTSASIQCFYDRLKILKSDTQNYNKLRFAVQHFRFVWGVEKIKNWIQQIHINKIKYNLKQFAAKQLVNTLQKNHRVEQKSIQKAIKFNQNRLKVKTIQSIGQLVQKKCKIQELASKLKLVKSKEAARMYLQNWKIYHKLQKIGRKLNKRVVFDCLRKTVQSQMKYVNLKRYRLTQSTRKTLKSLRSIKVQREKNNFLQAKSNSFLKWSLINKLRINFFSHLFRRKHLFMSIKFRAMILCRNAFKAWAKKEMQNPKISVFMLKKKRDRLSTDIAE